MAGGDEDLPEEADQGAAQRNHRRDEDPGHHRRQVQLQERAQKERHDHSTDEQRAHGAEGDRPADQPGALREHRELGLHARDRRFARVRQAGLHQPAAVDDPSQPIGEDGQHRAHAGEEKHRRHRKLDDVADLGEPGEILHRALWEGDVATSTLPARSARKPATAICSA